MPGTVLSNLQIISDLVIPQLCEISTVIVPNLKIRRPKLVRVTLPNYIVSVGQQGQPHGHASWAVSHTGPVGRRALYLV